MRQPQPQREIAVAVTGMACRLPGAPNVDALWDLLLSGKDAVSEVPADRWDWRRFYDPAKGPGKSGTKEGGFLTYWDHKAFDYRFFNLSAKEAEETDPQQRLLLECAVEALEDAGIAWRGKRIGVFIGGFALDMFTASQDSSENRRIGATTPTSGTATMLSARISHLLDLNGPSLTVDTACSSSLAAMHLGTQALLNGECDFALVGGANFMLRPEMSIAMSQGGFLSADGRSKSFDARADGYGRGEGCGMVFLQKADQARQRGDRIHAVVRATGINQDGHTQGIAQPNGAAQRSLMTDTLARAGLDPNSIRYVEAHGTGTAIGDATECQSISAAYCASHDRDAPCVVGSIKSSVGHLEAGAGIAAVIKTILALKNQCVPPQANLEQLNPKIAFDTLGLQIAHGTPTALPQTDQPLRAAINSFGYGGTNAHAILERARPRPEAKSMTTRPARLLGKDLFVLPLSAQSDEALAPLAEAYAACLEAASPPTLPGLLAAAGTHRSSLSRRALAIGRSAADLKTALEALSAGRLDEKLCRGRTVVDGPSEDGLAFVFSGMGPQWWGMGRRLLAEDDIFSATARRCDAAFQALAGWSILDELGKDAASSQMANTRIAQPANALVQIGLVDWLASIGLKPSRVVGHSTGEIAAGYAVGMLSAERAMVTAYWRSQLQSRLSGSGTMLALGCGEDDAAALLSKVSGRLSIAAINSHRAVTIAGDHLSLQKLSDLANEEGLFNRFLKVEIPYHSHLMESLEADVLATMAPDGDSVPQLPLYSTVTGGRFDGQAFDAAYWYRNIRNPVRFADAIGAMVDDGAQNFLEIGPHPTLAQYVREIGGDKGMAVAVTSTLSRDMDDETALTTALGRLYVQGFELPWESLAGSASARVDLPHYPWQRQDVWKARPRLEHHTRGKVVHPVLGRKSLDHRGSYISELNSVRLDWLPDHVIDGAVVFPAAGYIEIGAAIQSVVQDRKSFTLEDITFERGLTIADGDEPLLETTVTKEGGKLIIASSDPGQPASPPTRHASMTLSSGRPSAAAAIAVDDMLASCTEQVPGEQAYAQLSAHGLDYGPAFQLIETIHVGDNGSIATFSLPDADDYILHPCLMDACFQSVATVFEGADDSDSAYVPVGIRTLRVFGSLKALRHCLIRPVSVAGADDPMLDLTLVACDGEVLASVHGFTLGKVQTNQTRKARASAIGLYALDWEVASPAGPQFDVTQPWLALLDQKSKGHRYIEALRQQGFTVVEVGPDNRADVAGLLDTQTWLGVVDFSPLDANTEDGGASAVAKVLQSVTECAKHGVDLVVVTEQAQPFTPAPKALNDAQSAVLGALRVARNEYTSLRIGSLDVARPDATDPARLIEALSLLSDYDEVVVDGVVLTPLLQPVAGDQTNLPVIFRSLGERPTRLEMSKALGIDGLHWQDDLDVPSSDSGTCIRIDAVALNFKDILKALDRLPKAAIQNTFQENAIGMEVAATVIRSQGHDSRFKEGDAIVCVVKHGFRTHATIPSDGNLIWVPALPDLTPAENAAQPTTFITALYALETLANLEEGEDVLIHSAAGGVGQAAIQVARQKGARVFATAGTEEKRQILREQGCDFVYDSRALDFKEAILAETGGRGVDVVLNSIPGEVARTSLGLLCHWGRFIEIGKADFVEDRPIASRAFNQSISYHAFDLDQMQKERPDIFQKHLDRVWERLRNGTYQPLRTTVFQADDVHDAFRYLAHSKNIGKVAIALDPATVIESKPSDRIDLSGNPDPAYLVTGGLSGLGLATANWLASRGAKNVVLASRQGQSSPLAGEARAALEAAGTNVMMAGCDVAKPEDVEALVASISAKGWNLKGVFHAAAVLDDGLIGSQTRERIASVMDAKAKGATNLHQATRDVDLDHFVLFSSISSIIGTSGQVSYAAANAALDALAHRRHNSGLPALSINWGPIAEVGMAARDAGVLKTLEQNGLTALNPTRALDQLDMLLRSDLPQAVVATIDWDRFLQVSQTAGRDPRFQHLAGTGGPSGPSPIMEELSATPVEERQDLVAALLIEIVAEAVKVPAETIDPETKLMDIGVDSLMATEIQLALAEIGLNLSTMEIGQGLPIDRLAAIALSKLDLEDRTAAKHAAVAAE